FSEMLGSELAAGEQLRVSPGELVARMKTDLALPPADRFARETLQRIRRLLDVDWVVGGSFIVEDGAGGRRIRFDVALQDASSGDALSVFTEVAPESELFELVARTGARLRDALGVRGSNGGPASRAAQPTDLEAARLYAQALVRRRAYDDIGA